MDPETELLLACARTVLDGGHTRRIAELVAAGPDWQRLVHDSQVHGVLPLLHKILGEVCPEAVPPAVAERVEAAMRASSARCLRLAGELLRLQDLLAGHGIRAVPYKGPTLAEVAYGNVALRQFTDLDFLLPDDDVCPARDLLRVHGYRSLYGLTPEQEADYLSRAGQISLVDERSECVVELHAEVVSHDLRVPVDVDALLARAVPVTLLGRATCSLCAEDLLVVLCIHAGKHGWTSLGWVCDVAELVGTCPELDWPGVMRHVESIRAARMLRLGLLLTEDLLGAAIPEPAKSAVSADKRLPRLSAEVRERLLGKGDSPPGILREFSYHLRLRDRLLDGARYCWSMAMAPQPADWAALPLPRPLRFLYHGYRPLRLVYRHAVRPVARRLHSMVRPVAGLLRKEP
jgi:hypothetical protein